MNGIIARADLTQDSALKEIGTLALGQVNAKLEKLSVSRRAGNMGVQKDLRALNYLVNEHPNREAIFGSDSKWELKLPESLAASLKESVKPRNLDSNRSGYL